MSAHGPIATRAPGRFVAAEIGVTHPEETPRLATYTVARDGEVTGTAAGRAVSAGTAAAATTKTEPATKPATRRRRRRTPARTAPRTTEPSGGSATRARSSMSRNSASSTN